MFSPISFSLNLIHAMTTMLMFAFRSILVITTLCFPSVSQAQFVSSLPRCIQDCIEQSQYDNCRDAGIGCLCRASAGSFLPDLVNCMQGNCDLNAGILLESLQAVCIVAGAPIPDQALQNAGNQATSIQQVTTTVTIGLPSATGDPDIPTTAYDGYSEVTTMTETKTQDDGLTITVVYPITLWRTATISGAESTITLLHPSSSTTSHSEYSTPTITTTESTPGSTFLVATTLKGAQTSSSVNKATITPSLSQDDANSSPFKDSNSSGFQNSVGVLIGLTGLLVMGIIWF